MYMYVKLSTKRIKVLLLISAVCNTYFFFFFFGNKITLKSLLVIHAFLFLPLLVCFIMYHVLVLTVRQYNMRHKNALWARHQAPDTPLNWTFPPVPRVSGLRGFYCSASAKERVID